MTGEGKAKFRFMQFWKREKGIANNEVVYANSTRNDRSSLFRRIIYFITTAISVFVASVFVRRVDAVICVSLPITFMVIGYFISLVRRVPFIIEVRDIGVAVAHEVNVVRESWLYNYIYRIESYLYRSADIIIAVSDGFKDRLIERGVHEDIVHVVKLGFDGYEDDLISPGLEMPFTEDKFVVLYSGTLGHVFNVQLIIDAASQLVDYEDILFIFLGGGQKINFYKQISDEKKLNTFFLGNLPKYKVTEYCNRANLCIYPAKEGVNINAMLGNKIFDYLGNGCPCIYAGPGGDVANFINDAGGGLTCSGISEQLSEAILYMHNNPLICKQMGDSARNHISNSYQSNHMADKFISIIDRIEYE